MCGLRLQNGIFCGVFLLWHWPATGAIDESVLVFDEKT
jgi:hypothetical protein